MNELAMVNLARLIGASTLLVVACTPISNSTEDSSQPAGQSRGRQQVTFHLAGMNQRLKIL